MELSNALGKAKRLSETNALLTIIVGIQTIATIAAFIMLGKALNYQKTVLVPPSIKSTLEISGNEASVTYLREWGYYITHKVLSYTPSSAPDQFNDLLSLYAPGKDYDNAKEFFSKLYERIKISNTQSSFVPTAVYPDRSKSVIKVSGIRTIFGDRGNTVESKARTYEISYQYEQGRIWIKDIAEIEYQDLRQSIADDLRKP